MAAIKIHAGTFTDPGITSCDFRGRDLSGETRYVVAERDPATDAEIETVLEIGPRINLLFDSLSPSERIGLEAGLRIGVFDE